MVMVEDSIKLYHGYTGCSQTRTIRPAFVFPDLSIHLSQREKDNMATIRNLKIKTSTCKRIVKELHSYEQEVEREAAKTADMKEKRADPYDLKQQENVLGESRMMVPDCRKRLETSIADLKATLTDMEDNGEKEGPEIEEARKLIADADHLFQARHE